MSTFAGLAKFGLSDENGEVTLDVVGGKYRELDVNERDSQSSPLCVRSIILQHLRTRIDHLLGSAVE